MPTARIFISTSPTRYGAERLTQLADATAGRVPFFGAGAFKHVFGRPRRTLWDDFREAREQRRRAAQRHRRARPAADAPRVHRHRAARRPATAPSTTRVANADGFPALMALPPGGAPRRIAWRVLGNRTSVRGDWIVFDQLERVRSVALYSDLYAVRTGGGSPCAG